MTVIGSAALSVSRVRRVGLILFLVASFQTFHVNAATLSMTLEDNVLVLSGLTPGGEAIFFGVQKLASPRGHFQTSRRYASVEKDVDNDGVVRYSPERGVSLDSIWSGTDFTNGALTVLVPSGFRTQPIPLQGRGVHRGVAGMLNQLSTSLKLIEVLIVRPGKGAWVYTAGEGGKNDQGAKGDGKIDVTADRFVPLIGEETTNHFLPRDGMVLIDVATMRFHTSQVSE